MPDSENIIQPVTYSPWLHRYIILVVFVTGILIYAGGLVTTLGAGLAVPDWPLSFGSLNPSGWWRQPMVREEHSHRLIGATVGFLTLAMAIWIYLKEKSKHLRFLGGLALIMVIIQGIFGGLRVIDKNIYFAMVHACLAQVFFCTLVTLMWISSDRWITGDSGCFNSYTKKQRRIAVIVFSLVVLQLIIGAVMRHSGAGLAIPTFPLVFDGIFPKQWSFDVGIHYCHRVLAFLIFLHVLIQWIGFRGQPFSPVSVFIYLTGCLVVFQIFLGGTIIITGKGIVPTNLHVLTGAFLFALTFSTLLWQNREFIKN